MKITKENKNKFIIIAIVILIIILVVSTYFILMNMEKFTTEEESNNFGKIVRILDEKPTEEEMQERKQYVENLINTQENIIENVEIEDAYAPIQIVTEEGTKTYQLAYKGELNIGVLIEAVALTNASNIKTNKIEVGNKNSIKIDFNKENAPININEYVASEWVKQEMLDNTKLAKCILDSIKETIKANFGEEKNIYYNSEGKDIQIEGLEPIKANKIY